MRFSHSAISFVIPEVNAFKFLKSISKTALGWPAAAKTVLTPEFSNPYDTKTTAIADGATATAPVCSKANRGKTNIGSVTDTTTKETTFYIHTCFDEASSTETNVVSNNFLME